MLLFVLFKLLTQFANLPKFGVCFCVYFSPQKCDFLSRLRVAFFILLMPINARQEPISGFLSASHGPDLNRRLFHSMSQFPDSNRGPTHYECVALPTEPNWQTHFQNRCKVTTFCRNHQMRNHFFAKKMQKTIVCGHDPSRGGRLARATHRVCRTFFCHAPGQCPFSQNLYR